jgi:hypothetical protein
MWLFYLIKFIRKVNAMKNLLKAAVLMAAFSSTAANANQAFDFSYTFSSGDVLHGTLLGTMDSTSTYVTNITDVSAWFDNTQLLPDSSTGYLDIVAWNTSTSGYDDTITPVFSTNIALNNFAIADTDMAVNLAASNYFSFINDTNYGQVAIANNNNTLNSNGNALTASDSPAGGVWSVTAVPLPGAMPLLLSGLGLLAAASRRRIAV